MEQTSPEALKCFVAACTQCKSKLKIDTMSFSEKQAVLSCAVMAEDYNYVDEIINDMMESKSFTAECIDRKAIPFLKSSPNKLQTFLRLKIEDTRHELDIKEWQMLLDLHDGQDVASIPTYEAILTGRCQEDNRSVCLARIALHLKFQNGPAAYKYIHDFVIKFAWYPHCLPDVVELLKIARGDVLEDIGRGMASVYANREENDLVNLHYYMITHMCRGSIWRDFPFYEVSHLTSDPMTSSYAKSMSSRILASFMLVSRKSPVEAICVLKSVLDSHPNDFLCRLMLVVVYLYCGAMEPALEHIQCLQVKQLQYNSLGYLITDHIFALGYINVSGQKLLDQMLWVYEDFNKSLGSLLSDAFAKEVYAVIPDQVKFSQRMTSSLQKAACICGSDLSRLLQIPPTQFGPLVESFVAHRHLSPNFPLDLIEDRDSRVLSEVDIVGLFKSHVYDSLNRYDSHQAINDAGFLMLLSALWTRDSDTAAKAKKILKHSPIYDTILEKTDEDFIQEIQERLIECHPPASDLTFPITYDLIKELSSFVISIHRLALIVFCRSRHSVAILASLRRPFGEKLSSSSLFLSRLLTLMPEPFSDHALCPEVLISWRNSVVSLQKIIRLSMLFVE